MLENRCLVAIGSREVAVPEDIVLTDIFSHTVSTGKAMDAAEDLILSVATIGFTGIFAVNLHKKAWTQLKTWFCP